MSLFLLLLAQFLPPLCSLPFLIRQLRIRMSSNFLSLALAGALALILPPAISFDDRAPGSVPSYVTQYAPVVYLASTDKYFPSDIGAQLGNTHPDVNSSTIIGAPSPLTLDNLGQLNSLGGEDVYLTSNENVTTNPSYLYGVAPDASGRTGDAFSCAVIVNDHGNGAVDAFYMYFYAFDFGGVYVGLNVGNHVGDWEHNMVRFQDGLPTAIWYSQHSNGEAFTYDVVNKYDGGDRVRRPLDLSIVRQQLTNGKPAHSLQRKRIPCKLRDRRRPRLRYP